MHVVTVRKEVKGTAYVSHLLRRSFREDGKVKSETLANLSNLPDHVVAAVKVMLKGESLVSAYDAFDVTASTAHGHVQAVLTAMQRLGIPALLSSTPCRERDLVVALIAARILNPDSKLASTRWWHTTTLAAELGVADATEADIYAAMDWLLGRQSRIEKKLAKRHLKNGELALYDLSSSYVEGACCPLAKLGYSRDGKRGTLQITYGLLTDQDGRPVSITVYPGNTTDSTTVMEQVAKLRDDFGLQEVGLVGDRGMITQSQIDEMKGKLDWVTALKGSALRALVEQKAIQLSFFDETNLFAFQHPDYPGERLIACRNPELGRRRAHKRQSMLDATATELDKVVRMVETGKLSGQDKIGVRVGKVVNKYLMAKHFRLTIEANAFTYAVDPASVAAEAALDGLYVVRTSFSAERLDDADAVRSYKLLTRVERAFRTLKGLDLEVRPIYHHLENRVRSHVFLCMLAYYVRWHMMEAWRELLFADEDQAAKARRDPVAPAKRSETATAKAQNGKRADGGEPHSFRTLLESLTTIVRNECRRKQADDSEPAFTVMTSPNAEQRRAFDLLETIGVSSER
jgi:hypothetical protein